MENIKPALAEIKFSVETTCPNCHQRNSYHQLSAIHSNMKGRINKDGVNDIKMDARCVVCDKWYKIVKVHLI